MTGTGSTFFRLRDLFGQIIQAPTLRIKFKLFYPNSNKTYCLRWEDFVDQILWFDVLRLKQYARLRGLVRSIDIDCFTVHVQFGVYYHGHPLKHDFSIAADGSNIHGSPPQYFSDTVKHKIAQLREISVTKIGIKMNNVVLFPPDANQNGKARAMDAEFGAVITKLIESYTLVFQAAAIQEFKQLEKFLPSNLSLLEPDDLEDEKLLLERFYKNRLYPRCNPWYPFALALNATSDIIANSTTEGVTVNIRELLVFIAPLPDIDGTTPLHPPNAHQQIQDDSISTLSKRLPAPLRSPLRASRQDQRDMPRAMDSRREVDDRSARCVSQDRRYNRDGVRQEAGVFHDRAKTARRRDDEEDGAWRAGQAKHGERHGA